jgi:hypothetical protein
MTKKEKKLNPGQVIIPAGHPNPPEPHEIEAARILARHFRCAVEFLVPVDDYKRKTPDIVMLGVEFEIKSPTGKSKHTIGYQFRRASKQSKHIILDGRRTPISDTDIMNNMHFELAKRSTIKRLIFISKSSEVIEITP